jgi:hypothetical protein
MIEVDEYDPQRSTATLLIPLHGIPHGCHSRELAIEQSDAPPRTTTGEVGNGSSGACRVGFAVPMVSTA